MAKRKASQSTDAIAERQKPIAVGDLIRIKHGQIPMLVAHINGDSTFIVHYERGGEVISATVFQSVCEWIAGPVEAFGMKKHGPIWDRTVPKSKR